MIHRTAVARGIHEQGCREENLGYLNPTTVDVATFDAGPTTLFVLSAGEVLFRLR